jgi:YtkA-like protein
MTPLRTGMAAPVHRAARVGYTLLCILLLAGPAAVALFIRLQPASADTSFVAPPAAARAVVPDVGPNAVRTVLSNGSYRLNLQLTGNPSLPGAISLRLTKSGRPVDGARIEVTYTSLKMKMPPIARLLPRTGPGLYARPGPALSMSGRWRLRFSVSPAGRRPFSVSTVDRVAAL